jgi:hypothetical protein
VSPAAWWTWLFEQHTGVVAALAAILGVLLPLAYFWKSIREGQKHRAETRKLDEDVRNLAAARLDRQRQPIIACSASLLESAATMVRELNNVFYPFAYPPANVSPATLQEWIVTARRYRHEQAYRTALERLVSELAARSQGDQDPALVLLQQAAERLLQAVSEKKIHVPKIEEHGLTPEIVADVREWLDRVRELQIGLASHVGAIAGRTLAQLSTAA